MFNPTYTVEESGDANVDFKDVRDENDYVELEWLSTLWGQNLIGKDDRRQIPTFKRQFDIMTHGVTWQCF